MSSSLDAVHSPAVASIAPPGILSAPYIGEKHRFLRKWLRTYARPQSLYFAMSILQVIIFTSMFEKADIKEVYYEG